MRRHGEPLFSRRSGAHGRGSDPQRGSAVITALVLAAVTAIVAASFVSRAAHEARLANRSFYGAVALNLAEAGIEEAMHALNANTYATGGNWSLASGSTTDYVRSITSGFTFGQGSGALHIRIDNAASATPTVTSAGVITIPKQPRIVKQIRVGGRTGSRIWSNGIVAKGAVTFSGSADIDSYDSSLGPYNALTNRSDKATVATNTTVTLTGAAAIYGYVATGGSQPNVGGSGRVYGATSPSSPLVDPSRVRTDFNTNLTDATAPTGTATSLGAYSIGGVTSATLPRAGDLPGPNGRYLYTCSSMSVGASGNLKILGPVDIIVTGNVSVGGAAYIAVGGVGATDPSLNLYSPGTIDIGGSGMVNNTSLAIKATIWGTLPTGATKQSITVSGAGAFTGTIYAPNGNITLSGSGGVYGAVIGNAVTLSGASDIHYDVQLGSAVSVGGPTPGASGSTGTMRLLSWSELTGIPGGGSAFARDSRQPFAALF